MILLSARQVRRLRMALAPGRSRFCLAARSLTMPHNRCVLGCWRMCCVRSARMRCGLCYLYSRVLLIRNTRARRGVTSGGRRKVSVTPSVCLSSDSSSCVPGHSRAAATRATLPVGCVYTACYPDKLSALVMNWHATRTGHDQCCDAVDARRCTPRSHRGRNSL